MDEQEYMRKMQENERLYMYGDLKDDHDPINWSINWRAWGGAKKHEPRPSGKVDVVLRGGQALMEMDAAELYWKHSGKDGDIVFWRHAQEIDDETFPIVIPEKSAEKPRSQRTRKTLSE